MDYRYSLRSGKQSAEGRGPSAWVLGLAAYCLVLTASCLLLAATALGQTATAQGQTQKEVERITVDELKALLARNEPVTIIDARAQGSYDASDSKIKGAIRLTYDEIESHLKEIPRDKEIVTYCT